MNHAYIVNLSSHDELLGKMVKLGGNAPTHLVITSPFYSPGGFLKNDNRNDPTPQELAEKEARRASRLATLEAERAARAKISAERREEERRARAELAERNRAAYKARVKIKKPKDLSPLLDTRIKKPKPKPVKISIPVPPGYVGIEEASKMIGVCINTTYKYINEKTTSCYIIGRRKYVNPDELRADRDSRQKLWDQWNRSLGQRRKEASKK